jgi:uncharacterized membrane protein YcaP (DUF421 family)
LAAASSLGVAGSSATVARAGAVYVFLLVVFRVAGRRTLSQITNFDLILVLIIGDATQQAVIGEDYTITTGLVAVSTLVLLDVALAKAKHAWRQLDVVADGLPLVLVAHGTPDRASMTSEGIELDDILTAAREAHGLTRLQDVEYAILERSGGISIVPAQPRANSVFNDG